MIDRNGSWRKIITFIVLTFAISAIFYSAMIFTGSTRDIGFLWMWSPAASAFLTQWMFHGSIRDFGWKLGLLKYYIWGLIIPILYALTIYGIAWTTGLAGFRPPSLAYLLFLPLGLLAACLAALGEEIGWRGLLVPELSKLTTFTKTVLLTGVIWAIWHYPAIIFADYHSQAPRWFDIATLTISVLGLSCFTAWLRLESGSLWPVVLWHGAHNLFMQEAFLHMSTNASSAKFLIDDFGIGLVLASGILGLIAWKKRTGLSRSIRVQTKGTD